MRTLLSPLLARWRARILAWQEGRTTTRDFSALGVGETERILRDIGLSMDDMAAVTKPHAGPAVLLPKRLEQLGLDPSFIEDGDPATYRDLQRTCLRCTSWRRCARDLAAHQTQPGQDFYCLNGEVIDAMLLARDGGRTSGPSSSS
jgi:hypothetical protein